MKRALLIKTIGHLSWINITPNPKLKAFVSTTNSLEKSGIPIFREVGHCKYKDKHHSFFKASKALITVLFHLNAFFLSSFVNRLAILPYLYTNSDIIPYVLKIPSLSNLVVLTIPSCIGYFWGFLSPCRPTQCDLNIPFDPVQRNTFYCWSLVDCLLWDLTLFVSEPNVT